MCVVVGAFDGMEKGVSIITIEPLPPPV